MTDKEKLEALLRKAEGIREDLDDVSTSLETAKTESESAKGSASEAESDADAAKSNASSAESAASEAHSSVESGEKGLGKAYGRLEELDAGITEFIRQLASEGDKGALLTDEEKDDFIVTLGGKMRSRFQQAIADVLDDTVEEAVNSTLKEVERHSREKGGN